MLNMIKQISIFSAIFFIAGVGFSWALSTPHLPLSVVESAQAPDLRILTAKGILPEDLIESFQIESGVIVEVVHYEDAEDLDKKLRQGTYDIALLSHLLIPQLKLEGRIKVLNHTRLKNIENLSPDFRDLPTDPGSRHSIPLVWGVKSSDNNRAHLGKNLVEAIKHKESLFAPHLAEANILPGSIWSHNTSHPVEKKITRQVAALWVQSFVIPTGTSKQEMAHSLLEFFLRADVAKELSKLTYNSSTNKAIEPSGIDSSLKASHIRTQRLSQITKMSY